MKNFLLYCSVHLISVLSTDEKLKLLEKVSSVDDFLSLSHSDIELIIGRKIPKARIDVSSVVSRAEKEEKILALKNISWIDIMDDRYPFYLKNSFNPPFLLFFVGNFDFSGDFCVSVVGTRHPTLSASRVAYAFSRDIVLQKGIVVSGLANGIDTSAHKGAVDADGRTIAVLGSGLDNIYPVTNRRLAQRIVEKGGAIVSEYVPGAEARKFHFPERNRIIACLSRGTIVVEAPLKSGALITAEHAMEEGRDVFVPLCVPKTKNSEGAYFLLEQGASGIKSVYDIMNDWGIDINSKNKNADKKEAKSDSQNFSDPASAIVSMMEKELAGEIVRHKGDIIEG